MPKTNHQATYSDYELVPVFGTEAVEPAFYALSAIIAVGKRSYGNLGLLKLDQSSNPVTDKVFHRQEHVSPAHWEQLHTMRRHVNHAFNRQSCREGLWKRAVENLYKRVKFLELNIELLQDDITEEEFEQTITEQDEAYVISLANVRDPLEAEAIQEVVRALGRSLDVHEVAELFGVKPEQLHQLQAERAGHHVGPGQEYYLTGGR